MWKCTKEDLFGGGLCNDLIFRIISLRRGNLGNYFVSGNLENKLVLSGSFVINRGD